MTFRKCGPFGTIHITTASADVTKPVRTHQQFRHIFYDRIIQLRRKQFPQKVAAPTAALCRFVVVVVLVHMCLCFAVLDA